MLRSTTSLKELLNGTHRWTRMRTKRFEQDFLARELHQPWIRLLTLLPETKVALFILSPMQYSMELRLAENSLTGKLSIWLTSI